MIQRSTVALLASISLSVDAAEVCPTNMVMCSNVGTIRQCTGLNAYGVMSYNNSVTSATGAANCSLTGNNSYRNFMAQRPTMAGPGACSFAGTFVTLGGMGPFTYTCVINEADGLPVELLDFDID